MAFPAFQLSKKSFAVRDAVNSHRRLSRNFNWLSGFFLLPARRESLDVSHQVRPFLFSEGVPNRHVAVGEAASNGVVEILICWQRPGRRRTALEGCNGKVARLGIKPHCVLAVAVSLISVSSCTISPVV